MQNMIYVVLWNTVCMNIVYELEHVWRLWLSIDSQIVVFLLHILQKPESAVRALLFHSLLIETHEGACKISAKNGYFHIASESSHINFSPEYLSKMGKWPTKYLVPNVALWLRIFQDKRQSFVFSLKFKALKHRVKCFKCKCTTVSCFSSLTRCLTQPGQPGNSCVCSCSFQGVGQTAKMSF